MLGIQMKLLGRWNKLISTFDNWFIPFDHWNWSTLFINSQYLYI